MKEAVRNIVMPLLMTVLIRYFCHWLGFILFVLFLDNLTQLEFAKRRPQLRKGTYQITL